MAFCRFGREQRPIKYNDENFVEVYRWGGGFTIKTSTSLPHLGFKKSKSWEWADFFFFFFEKRKYKGKCRSSCIIFVATLGGEGILFVPRLLNRGQQQNAELYIYES